METREIYADYYRGVLELKKVERCSTPKSILNRLKELRNQEFIVNVPVGEADE